jgi:hypothetical protein
MYTLELANLNASLTPGYNLEVNHPQINVQFEFLKFITKYFYLVTRCRIACRAQYFAENSSLLKFRCTIAL